jgi:hypothetical protein
LGSWYDVWDPGEGSVLVDETPVVEVPLVLPDLSDLGCGDGCGAERYCRSCREETRAEALRWLSDISDDHVDRWGDLADRLVLLAPPSAFRLTHP